MGKKFDPALLPPHPNLGFELRLWEEGVSHIAGIDEAGRGALAGPVAAGAVVLPQLPSLAEELKGVNDSKQMTAEARQHWLAVIQRTALSFAVGYASAVEIDEIGIAPATRLAAKRAIEQLSPQPQHLLIDYIRLPEIDLPQTSLPKGDARSLSIACASVLAKVGRDTILCQLNDTHPQYGFAQHKGYGTAAHRAALTKHGGCQVHRYSFAPLRVEEET